MKNNFFNSPLANINLKPSLNSEVISQILYGEKFKILSKKKIGLRLKQILIIILVILKKSKYYEKFKPTNKICKLKSRIFKKINNKFLPTNKFSLFCIRYFIKNQDKNYIEFKKNKWIKKNDTKKINHYEKDFVKILNYF